MGNRLIRVLSVILPAIVGVVAFALAVRLSTADTPQAATEQKEEARSAEEEEGEGETMLDPLGPNAACYVCHMTFVFEELAKTHLAEKTTCIECHGLSAAHANDENIGATKPDITYRRDEIDASCEKCHEEHDVSAQEVIGRFLERELKDPKPVCTDCHGMHRIEHAEEDEAPSPSTTSEPKKTEAKVDEPAPSSS